MPETQTSASRKEQVVEAALRVLGDSGSKGLTHRAVDTAAGVPQGTTSNYFRTRSSLLEAALERHVELDTPPEAALAGIRNLELSDDEALALIMSTMDRLLDPSVRNLLAARYELVLESSRKPELHDAFEPARQSFVDLAEALVTARGCRRPREHARHLVVVLDGALMDTLLGAESALDRDGIRDLMARQLATC